MGKIVSLSLLAAVAALTLAAPVSAQGRSVIESSALEAAVAAHPTHDRAVVTSALTSTNALAIAASMGLSPNDVSARIAALDDAAAQQVADKILAGGDSKVVISTTAIIIGLLLLILLVK